MLELPVNGMLDAIAGKGIDPGSCPVFGNSR